AADASWNAWSWFPSLWVGLDCRQLWMQRALEERSERAHGDDPGIGFRHHGVAERATEGGHVDLETVADARLDALGGTQDGCAEVVGMGVAGPPEHRVAEMVVLEIADRVRHVGLAAQEFALPDDLVAAHDAGMAAHVLRQLAEQELRPQRALPQLR